jgi:hypothetical protein
MGRAVVLVGPAGESVEGNALERAGMMLIVDADMIDEDVAVPVVDQLKAARSLEESVL